MCLALLNLSTNKCPHIFRQRTFPEDMADNLFVMPTYCTMRFHLYSSLLQINSSREDVCTCFLEKVTNLQWGCWGPRLISTTVHLLTLRSGLLTMDAEASTQPCTPFLQWMTCSYSPSMSEHLLHASYSRWCVKYHCMVGLKPVDNLIMTLLSSYFIHQLPYHTWSRSIFPKSWRSR